MQKLLHSALAWAKAHGEVLRYLVFGGLTTLLNILLYALFQAVFGYEAANSWGNVLDNLLCILFAYATNRRWVFASKTHGRAAAKEFCTFVACRLGTMVIDAVIMVVGGNWLAVPGAAVVFRLLGRWLSESGARTLWGLGVKVLSNIIVIVLNYLFSKRLVFRRRQDTGR